MEPQELDTPLREWLEADRQLRAAEEQLRDRSNLFIQRLLSLAQGRLAKCERSLDVDAVCSEVGFALMSTETLRRIATAEDPQAYFFRIVKYKLDDARRDNVRSKEYQDWLKESAAAYTVAQGPNQYGGPEAGLAEYDQAARRRMAQIVEEFWRLGRDLSPDAKITLVHMLVSGQSIRSTCQDDLKLSDTDRKSISDAIRQLFDAIKEFQAQQVLDTES